MNLLNKCTDKEIELMKKAGVYIENKDELEFIEKAYIFSKIKNTQMMNYKKLKERLLNI